MPCMMQQQTLRATVRFAGIGLHGGNQVEMAILPAPANSGLRFRRVDLEGKPEMEARIENVNGTKRSTTLAKGNVKIHTVEHVLAALTGCGVDNAIIELDANEPPIADGSAREYCRMIRDAGLVPLAETREPFVVKTPLELQLGDTNMAVFPHERWKITCVSSDKHGRFTQQCSLEITPENWEKELSHARTFCFFEEIEALIKNGLIKGGSLENAVVIRDDAVLTTEPLRYPDEFVRHKILDIIGDLTLLGRPVCCHIIAIKPSHAGNCELVRQLTAQMRKPLAATQSFTPPPSPPQPKTSAAHDQGREVVALADGQTFDVMQVMKILPHRYPFLMVDKVTKIEGNRVTAVKNVTINEPYFQGHFPNHPIMPGVLQLEAMAQVSGVMMLRQADHMGMIAYFMSAENVKWRKPVRPGDTLVIEVELTKVRGKICKAKGVCRVEGEVVSEADVTFMLSVA